MASTLNSDNGIVSGTSGLKSSADSSGVLALQSSGSTGFTLNTSLALGVGSGNSTGTNGQVLTSSGSGSAPSWTTVGASAATPTALGTVYGKQTTVGGTPYLTAIGYNAGSSTTGVGVTAVGTEALYTNSAGARSTAMGYRAGYSNTGDNNLFVGNQSGFTNTTGTGNSFVGGMTSDNWPAGYYNTTGSDNSAFGGGALTQNTTGSFNTAVGTYALHLNTTASQGTAVGYSAGKNNTTGAENTAVGYEALKANTTGYNSVAVGRATLLKSNGNQNTAVGSNAMYENTSGLNNTAVGQAALYENTTGASNTAVGKGAGSLITTGSKNTVLGQYNGNQGSLYIRTASNYIVLSDGDGNPRGIFDGSGSFFVGTTSTPASSGAGSAFVSDGENRWKLIQNHNTTDPRALQSFYNPNGAIGSIQTSGSATSFNTSSDYRLKNTIAPMTGALAKVALLKPCTYKWNCDGSDGQGFIAHELAEVVPQCVTGEKDAVNEDGSIKSQGIDTSFLVATLTAAIQELKAEFDAYKASHP